jgi:hypothetical protein
MTKYSLPRRKIINHYDANLSGRVILSSDLCLTDKNYSINGSL